MAPISIGEIHVPGGAGLISVRCLTLTSPPRKDGGLELFFALFAAEAPKRVLEKLCDRLGDELRAVFFQSGNSETRFEASLKQANKTILSFLYEHGLSLPGVKLRGAAAALSEGTLYVSSRGLMRGLLFLPQAEALAPYVLFEDTVEKQSEPKFFTSLQTGAFPDGARLVIATSELFQSLDDTYVQDVLGQTDFAKASRDIKAALRNEQKAVSILSLSSLRPERATAVAKLATAPQKVPAQKNRRAEPPLVGPDIGEVITRGLRAGFLLLGRGLAYAGRGAWRLLKTIALVPAALPGLVTTLTHKEHRERFVAACADAPHRGLSAAVGRLNLLPHTSRVRFFALLAVAAVFVHGILFSVRHELRAQTTKAYDAQLAELHRLEADFDAGMIYDNEDRSRELVARMTSVWSSLPEDTNSQKKNKQEAGKAIDAARFKLRRSVTIEKPTTFATLSDPSFAPTMMAWFGDKLFVFSGTSGRVRAFSTEGAAVADPVITSLPNGIRAGVAARTGFLLESASGTLAYWNPDTAEETSYDAPDVSHQPILFYQGRLYAAAPDGTVTRRSVATKSLGSPTDVLRAAPASPTSIATDGAVYLLYKDGSTRKYLKGASVQDYLPTFIDPPPANADQLWASAETDKIIFIEKGGDRAFTLDKTTGRLLAQITAPEFSNLRAATVDASGRVLYLLAGNGTIYKVPLK